MTKLKATSLTEVLSANWPPEVWRDLTVLLAVSGGPDSVALLRAMVELKRTAGGAGGLVVGHFDHRLRPDSVADAQFVTKLAEEYQLPFELGHANVADLAAASGDGIEAAAREARYAFLTQAAERHGARYVVTGHTADDQVETVLFNILRGTGLAGLAGMRRARVLSPAVSLLRPLLTVRRAQVVEYLQEIGQPFRNDPSNASDDYTRNRLRNELLPLLRENYNPDVDSALVRLAHLAGDAQEVLERQADALLSSCFETVSKPSPFGRGQGEGAGSSVMQPHPDDLVQGEHRTTVRLNLSPLAGIERHLIREMFIALWRQQHWPLQQMGFCHWDQLAGMAFPSALEHSSADDANAKSALKCQTFPGNILVDCLESELHLRRG